MDEYDELFEIEDDFDDQFADELEALADLEKGEEQRTVANEVLLSFVIACIINHCNGRSICINNI